MLETLSITLDLNDYDSLNHDKETYGESKNQLKKMNGLINQIILNYVCDFTNSFDKSTIKISSHNSRNFKFRLSNETREYIDSNPDIFNFSKYSLPTYIRYILNCFCKLKNTNKVKILYKNIINQIELAISVKKKIIYTNSNNESKCISPLYLYEDKNINALYLVGFDENNHATSYRIFRICRVKIKNGNINYSKSDKSSLDNRLIHEGPIFLDEDPVNIKLILSKNGSYRYSNEKLFRPMFFKCENDIYEFECTRKQIKYYFFKLGKEVTIISPKDLQNDFISMYQDALNEYTIE